jgi:outer membrane protein OmpA-like peptidoglycan-associated protein
LQAALNAGEYTVMPVCPGEIGFDAVAWAHGAQSGQLQSIQVGPVFDAKRQIIWVEVSPSGRIWASPQLRDSVTWSTMQLHNRVVSRVVPQCQNAVIEPKATVSVSVAPALPEIRSMELASDLLFPFASSTINRSQADALLRERLRAVLPDGDVSRITRIRVIGHSDPVGQAHRKSLVSMQRAQEVANYLQSVMGITSSLFSVETQSDRQLLVANCPQQPVVQRNACNAPNRRVEVLFALKH